MSNSGIQEVPEAIRADDILEYAHSRYRRRKATQRGAIAMVAVLVVVGSIAVVARQSTQHVDVGIAGRLAYASAYSHTFDVYEDPSSHVATWQRWELSQDRKTLNSTVYIQNEVSRPVKASVDVVVSNKVKRSIDAVNFTPIYDALLRNLVVNYYAVQLAGQARKTVRYNASYGSPLSSSAYSTMVKAQTLELATWAKDNGLRRIQAFLAVDPTSTVLDLAGNHTAQLTANATITGSDVSSTVSYVSVYPGVAAVDTSGLVTAQAVGITDVIVQLGNARASVTVTVVDNKAGNHAHRPRTEPLRSTPPRT